VFTAVALRRCQQQEEELDANNNTTSLIPLVNSIKELAECQRRMILERIEDRNHERYLEVQRQQSDGAERSRERTFCQ
jgi:Na+-transporting NADH:ubiquinone oxidoreductase subunit NqrC